MEMAHTPTEDTLRCFRPPDETGGVLPIHLIRMPPSTRVGTVAIAMGWDVTIDM